MWSRIWHWMLSPSSSQGFWRPWYCQWTGLGELQLLPLADIRFFYVNFLWRFCDDNLFDSDHLIPKYCWWTFSLFWIIIWTHSNTLISWFGWIIMMIEVIIAVDFSSFPHLHRVVFLHQSYKPGIIHIDLKQDRWNDFSCKS